MNEGPSLNHKGKNLNIENEPTGEKGHEVTIEVLSKQVADIYEKLSAGLKSLQHQSVSDDEINIYKEALAELEADYEKVQKATNSDAVWEAITEFISHIWDKFNKNIYTGLISAEWRNILNDGNLPLLPSSKKRQEILARLLENINPIEDVDRFMDSLPKE